MRSHVDSVKVRLSAYVLPGERDIIEEAAAKNGFSVASFSRYLIKIGYNEFLEDPIKVFEAMKE